MSRVRLLTPGPVELHPRARLALSGAQVHHRTAPAREAFQAVREGLKTAFGTEGEVLLLTGSGTAAMEALVGGLFSPGERVVVPVSGKFSERWAEIAGALGLDVVRGDFPWGQPLSPEEVLGLLDRDTRGVLLTHSETSTGALNPIAAIAAAVRSEYPDLLVVVDAVTSLFLAPFSLDAMGLDAALAGSQKGLMLPPGLAFVALGPRALSRLRPYGYYLNLDRERKVQAKGESGFTPAINLVLAAQAVLDVLLPDLEGQLRTKRAYLERLYKIGEDRGLRPVPARDGVPVPMDQRTPATTAFYLPEGVAFEAFRDAFLARGARIAGGQGALKGRTFRISLMGYFPPEEAEWAFEVFEEALEELF